MQSRLHAALLAGALLAGAAPALAGQPRLKPPVAGWPALEVETHYVPRIAMRGACFPPPPGRPIPETTENGCARPDFWRGVCDIYIDVRHVRDAVLHEHLLQRCRGRDPIGSTEFADALRAWRELGQNRYGYHLDFDSMLFVTSPLDCKGGRCAEIR